MGALLPAEDTRLVSRVRPEFEGDYACLLCSWKCGDTILISATGDLDSDATSWLILLSMAVYTVKQLARLAGWRTDGR